VHFEIPVAAAAEGYLFAWITNQVAAAVRLIPLGQTSGQRLTLRALAEVPGAVACGLALEDAEIGASAPGLSCLSAQHETQYTRLFRS
jgi:urease accessory protein